MFAELICQSNFSFLQGASHPEELVTTASFLGYEAIAITDECSVSGVVRAWNEIQSNHLPVKLIVGSLFHFDASLTLVLLCPTKSAYSELCRIITNARRRSEKGDYLLSQWDLNSIRNCFIVWLPHIKEKDYYWGDWLAKYHPERSWIGASRQLDGTDIKEIAHISQLSDQYSFPIIATNKVLFHHPERQPLQHIIHAINKGKTVEALGFEALQNQERCLKPISVLSRLYPKKWLTESTSVAEQCNFCLSELKYQYPSELIPSGFTPTTYLRHCVETGIVKRFPEGVSASIRSIIEKELSLIHSEGYEYFFLTIYDIVQFAKAKGILYQGRGSAANSIVCYCLEITAVDPRQINVLFERFISKERNEPPDIDVDFEHERREEVIQYIYQKYGRERTALAATVITFRFKSAFREVGKALGFNESQLSYWIKQINRRDSTLGWKSQLMNLDLDHQSKSIQHLILFTETLLGFPRHLSQHVGGFVISSGPLYELVPIENASMPDRTVIQWDKDDLETLGLLKVDILALGMLTAIRKTLTLVEKQFGFSLTIPFIAKHDEDTQVFDALCKADTVGVFQIESRAQMSMLPRLKPRCYYDLVVQIAIVRPGPIQGDMVHPYLLRRHGESPIEYPSEEVKAVLSRTMGVPIFQEQVIQLAMVAAGFTGGEADQLRRAMASWKKTGKLNQFKSKLISGMTNRGYAETFAEQLFEQIMGFGEYGFPESHSASFAVLAYVSAWLKYYFPAEFFTGLLNSWPMGFYSPAQLIKDAQLHNIKIHPVCINNSDYDYTVSPDGEIRIGLRQIKDLNKNHVQRVILSRPAGGYSSINELLHAGLSRSDVEALASANALTAFSLHRYDARWQIADTQRSLPLFNTQMNLAYHLTPPTKVEEMVEDIASTGMSIDKHPIALLNEMGKLHNITFATDLHQKADKSLVRVIGTVVGRQSPGTAGGVTFLTLEDHTGNVNVIVWQRTARAQIQAFLNSSLLEIHGILERSKDGVCHIIAGKLINKNDAFAEKFSIKSRDFR